MTELAKALGELGVWVRLHYVYPYPHVDDVIPLMARRQAAAVSRRAVPAREPAHPEAHEAPGQRREHAGAHQGVARDLPRDHDPLDVHRRLSGRDRSRVRAAARLPRGGAARPRRLLRVFAGRRRGGQRAARSRSRGRARGAPRALHGRRRRGSAPRASRARSARRCSVLVDDVDGDDADRALDRRRAGDRRRRAHRERVARCASATSRRCASPAPTRTTSRRIVAA